MVKTEEEFLQAFRERTNDSDLLPSNMQDRGRLDILYGILSAELSDFEERINYEMINTNLITALDEGAIRNLASPFYSGGFATFAQGILTITRNNLEGDITIPEGTYVETSGTNPVQFITTETVYLYNTQDSVKVRIQAVQKGVSGMVQANTIRQVSASKVAGISANNAKRTWGGYDEETADSIREEALGARFSMVKTSKKAIELSLQAMHIEEYRYRLAEHAYGYGTGAIYFDAHTEEELKHVQGILNSEFAFGIYHRVEQTTPVDVRFNIYSEIYSETEDLTPFQKEAVVKELTDGLKLFLDRNGVGRKFIKARAIRFLFDQLDKFGIQDIEITTTGGLTDTKGNIIINAWETINPLEVSVSVNVA